MIVTFWGVRGSIPVPGRTTLRYGGNTPCTTVQFGDTLIIIDCGTGIRELGNALLAEYRRTNTPIHAHILISHTHWDHIQGFPFFAPAFSPTHTFTVYGAHGVNTQIEDTLAGQMENQYFPVALKDMAATLHFKTIDQGQFQLDGVTVTTCHANHPGVCLGFRLSCSDGSVVYLSDHEPYRRLLAAKSSASPLHDTHVSPEDAARFAHSLDDQYVEFCRGADLLIEDAPYTVDEYQTRVGWGHGCVDDVVAIAVEANVKQLALFHHEPNHSDDQMDGIIEYCQTTLLGPDVSIRCFAAQEGLRLVIPEKGEGEGSG